MKKFLSIALLLIAFALPSAAQVTFQFSDGISNPTLKANAERNISSLLSEINKACTGNRVLSLSTLKMTPRASDGLSNLWENIHFKCIHSSNVQSCIKDATGYEVRRIMVQMKPLDDTYKGSLTKELTVSFNAQGTITGVRMALDNNTYQTLLEQGTAVKDERLRREILTFVENFRSYYVEKDLKSIENIFSEDALIITGRVIKKASGPRIEGNTQIIRQQVEYSKENKKSYIEKLGGIFKRCKYVNIDFSDIEIVRHSSKPYYYGVRLRQKWATQQYTGHKYDDDGSLFLLWDFSDEENPQIHVRTWSPLEANDTFSPEDFFLPN